MKRLVTAVVGISLAWSSACGSDESAPATASPSTRVPTVPTVTATAAGTAAATTAPALSLIAFESGRDGSQEIYVMSPDGSNLKRLTENAVADQNPSWSLGCARIAFHSNRDGNQEIYVMDRDGANQTRLTNSLGLDVAPDWCAR